VRSSVTATAIACHGELTHLPTFLTFHPKLANLGEMKKCKISQPKNSDNFIFLLLVEGTSGQFHFGLWQ